MPSLTRHVHESLFSAGLAERTAAKPMSRPIVPAARESLASAVKNVPGPLDDNRCTQQPRRTIKTRHLLYHVWPVANNDLWAWNIEQLLKRIDLFNGRRVMAIVTDEESHEAATVKRRVAGHGFEFIEMRNHPRLREAGTFLRLLRRVKTGDPSAVTFYAHAKGVSRARTVHAVEKRWAECMYHHLLDYPERAMEALSRKGMFGVSFELERLWIYPGTFWWFHNASLFAKPDWHTLANPITKEGVGWSVEAFPNRFFADDCERFYPPELRYPKDTQFGLYDPRIWSDDVRVASLNERAKWRWGHAIEREWLTWGRILPGDNILAAVGRHARLARARILEIGPGYGRFVEALVRKRVPFQSYTGIDLSPQRSRELRQKYSERVQGSGFGVQQTDAHVLNPEPRTLNPTVRFVWGDIESVRDMEPLGRFDLIVATLVFKRLCPTFQLAATNCRHALVPGGKLIFDVPETGVDWPATEEAQIGSFESGWGFGAFSKSYRKEEICELLDAAGFVDIRFDAIVHDGDKRRLLVVATRG